MKVARMNRVAASRSDRQEVEGAEIPGKRAVLWGPCGSVRRCDYEGVATGDRRSGDGTVPRQREARQGCSKASPVDRPTADDAGNGTRAADPASSRHDTRWLGQLACERNAPSPCFGRGFSFDPLPCPLLSPPLPPHLSTSTPPPPCRRPPALPSPRAPP